VALALSIGVACTGLALRGADMSVRKVGIVGDALEFPAAVSLLATKLRGVARGAR
jgi:hypothetical protein